MTRVLGWTQFQNPKNPHLYTLPATTLRKLSEDVARKLDQPILRIVGDPDMSVMRVALTNWLKSFIKGVRIEFVATQQPFWTVSPARK